jgi:hypothetical protein
MGKSFRKSFVKIGWVIYFPTLCYVVRILWEKTYLTWTQGPQMIGFTLVHIYPLFFVVGVVGYLLCHAWVLAATFFLVRRKEFIVRKDVIQYCVITFTLMIDYVSVNNWQWFISFFIAHH